MTESLLSSSCRSLGILGKCQKGALMNTSNIMGALFPIFFVLALGYLAGRRNTFDADQAAGFSKLALSFALPAALFVSMTDIPRDLLLGQGRLVLACQLISSQPHLPIKRRQENVTEG